jgi:phenylpyruvate tautomerase PptA (4-oxalocrotonate tautomerase family)
VTIIRVDLIGTVLESEQKSELARRMISAFCEVEVGRDIEGARSGFVVHINEARADSVFMGDAPMVDANESGRAAIVTIQVMAGPWTNEMKGAVFERLERIVRDVAGLPKEGIGADVWMTLLEVPEGGWSLGGRPVSIQKLAGVFTEDRQQRIREYLEGGRTP